MDDQSFWKEIVFIIKKNSVIVTDNRVLVPSEGRQGSVEGL